jgi:hypothetical protein
MEAIFVMPQVVNPRRELTTAGYGFAARARRRNRHLRTACAVGCSKPSGPKEVFCREMRNAKGLRASDLRPKAVEVVLLIVAIFFLTLAVMQLAKGPIPDNPTMPGPSNSSVF